MALRQDLPESTCNLAIAVFHRPGHSIFRVCINRGLTLCNHIFITKKPTDLATLQYWNCIFSHQTVKRCFLREISRDAVMAQKPDLQIVRPLPKTVVKCALCLLFVAGRTLVWKDRFNTRARTNIESQVAVPAYK